MLFKVSTRRSKADFFFYWNQVPGNVEFHSKNIVYSRKKHLFLVVYEFSGATHEVVLYWENTDPRSSNSKASTIKGLLSYGFTICCWVELFSFSNEN